MNCTYCGNDAVGNYCSNCGQRSVSRFTWTIATAWVRDELFVLDRGFFFTVKELLIRPVTLVDKYLAGSTKQYFNPFKLLVILTTTTVAVLLLYAGDSFVGLGELLRNAPAAFTRSSFRYLLHNWSMAMTPNLIYHMTITTALMSTASWLLFRKRGLNYLEHLIFICFMGSFLILIALSTFPLWIAGAWLSDGELLLALLPYYFFYLGYLVVIGNKFYQESYWKVLVKGFLATYGSIIISMSLELILLQSAIAAYDSYHLN